MKLVIFDCDGTLVDSQHMIVAAMSQAFAWRGYTPPPRDVILSIVGLSLPYAVARLVPNMAKAEVEAISEGYKRAFAELRGDPSNAEPLYDGIRDLLDTLQQSDDVLLGIATGKSRRGVDRVVAHHALEGCFATIHTADDHPSKPHPEMIEAAMRNTGVDIDATVMIGDTTYDVEMAKAAGVRAFGVSWGYHPISELERAGSDLICRTGPELKGAVLDFVANRTA